MTDPIRMTAVELAGSIASGALTSVEVVQSHLSTYCPQRTGVLLDQYRANGWYS